MTAERIRNAKHTGHGIGFDDKRNKNLTRAIYDEVRASVAAHITKDPEYPQLQHGIVGAFFSCDDVEGFLPGDFRARHEAQLISTYKFGPEIPLALIDTTSLDPLYVSDVRVEDQGAFVLIPLGTETLSDDLLLKWTRKSIVESLKAYVRQSNHTLGVFRSKAYAVGSSRCTGPQCRRRL